MCGRWAVGTTLLGVITVDEHQGPEGNRSPGTILGAMGSAIMALPWSAASADRKGWSRPAWSSDTYLVDSSARRRLAEVRPVPRSEAWARAATERAVERVVSALDVNALLDLVDLNTVLDQVDIDRVLDRIDLDRLLGRMDLNELVKHIDLNALVEQTDLGAIIAASSSGVAGDVLDVVRSQTVGLDEFIARWIGRLRRRPYTGPPGPPGRLRSGEGQ